MRNNFCNYTLVAAAVALGLFVLVMLVASFFPQWFQSKKATILTLDAPAEVAWHVVWPEPNVHLDSLQSFVLVSPDGFSEFVTARWEVDGGVESGTMDLFDGQFNSMVDTATWDWNSDGSYEITFRIFDQLERELGAITVPVTIGGFLELVTEVIEEKPVVVKAPQPVYVEPAPQVLGVQSFSVEWKPAPVNQNQHFKYQLHGQDASTVSVFWKSEGGHENHVYPNGRGEFEAVINVNGWRWKGAGPYQLIFTVVDKATSHPLMNETFEMFWQGAPGESELALESKGVKVLTASLPTTSKVPTPQATPVASEVKPTSNTTPANPAVSVVPQMPLVPVAISPISSADRLLSVAKPAVERSLAGTTDANYKTALTYILEQPNAVWLNGDGHDSDQFVNGILAESVSRKALPTFVLYNIPHRDCGSHSSGGAKSATEYQTWINRLAGLLKNQRGLIILEPDALAQLNCAPESARSERLELLTYAVEKLSETSSHLRIYIDAGHPHWVNSTEMARRLSLAGVAKATGFSLNVSNYISTSDNVTYGNHLSNLLNGKRYVIDTSRNGNGPATNREWCNPSGRALGQAPQLFAGQQALDGYVWIKFPGESDGSCNGGPHAGGWWLEYAVGLYNNQLRR